jgi:uncharacterized protein with GYD domain
MPKYMLKLSYTLEGLKGVKAKGGSSRVEAAEGAVKSVGGSIEAFYFALGETDAFAIVYLPDVTLAAALALAIAASGEATVRTVQLVSPEDVDAASSREVGYGRRLSDIPWIADLQPLVTELQPSFDEEDPAPLELAPDIPEPELEPPKSERIEVDVEDHRTGELRTLAFQGHWLVEPKQDPALEEGQLIGVALTARGRIAVWWGPRGDAGSFCDFDTIEEAESLDLPEAVMRCARLALGGTSDPIVELDI